MFLKNSTRRADAEDKSIFCPYFRAAVLVLSIERSRHISPAQQFFL